MAEFEVSRRIAAPPERVFEIASDFANAAEHVRAIEKVEMLTPGPIAVGTRFRETRRMFGKSATEELEVVEYDPPRRYVLGAQSHGSRFRSEIRVSPAEGGSEIAMRFEAVPLNFAAKAMSFLMKPMMNKMSAECAKDLDDVAAAAER